MNSDAVRQEKRVWNSAAYWVPVLLAAYLAFFWGMTTDIIGVDDIWITAADRAMNLSQGRALGWFLLRIFQTNGAITQPFVGCFGPVVYIFALTLLCDFWQSITQGRLRNVELGFFSALFLSYPLTHELISFRGVADIGLGLAASVCAVRLCRNFSTTKSFKPFLLAVVCLMLVVGDYEALVLVYSCTVIGTFWLEWQQEEHMRGDVCRQFTKALPYIFALALGIFLNWIVGNAVFYAAEGHFISSGYGWDFAHPLAHLRLLLQLLVSHYVLFALEHLPLTLMWIAILGLLVYAVREARRCKSACPLFFFAAMTFSVFMLTFVAGAIIRYRAACWPIAFYIGFTGMLYLNAYAGAEHKKGKTVVFLCAAYLLYTQCNEMTYRYHIDALRWQEEKAVVSGIAQEYERDFDTAKPLVIVGRHKLGNQIFDANYLHKDSLTMRFIARYFPDNEMNERQYYCRRLVETEADPVISWALDSGDLRNVEQLFKSCGYDITVGTEEMFAGAEALRETMPDWPARGSMADMGEYILVDLGEEFYDGF